MKKIILSLFLVSIFAGSALAQSEDQYRLSLDVDLGIPVGGASQKTYFGVGGSLKFNYLLTKNIFVTVSPGYRYLHGKTHTVISANENTIDTTRTAFDIGGIPLKGGLRYYFDENYFVEGQAGVVFFTEGGKGSAFVYSPSFGYTFSGGFEVDFRYESWSNVQYARFPGRKGDTLGQALLTLSFGF